MTAEPHVQEQNGAQSAANTTGHIWFRRLPADAVVLAGAIGAIVIPVLLFGPWLPFVDLVSFVGMYSYPPTESYGPLHYYLFQFSYTGVLMISRALCDLHFPVRFQIPFYYLLQMGVCLAVVRGTLQRLAANPWWRSIGVALGSLALWDGVFVWGGPLGFSLGTCSLSLATFLVCRDAVEVKKDAGLVIFLLIVFSLCCHPFIAPFALILCGVRFLYDGRHRWNTLVMASGIMLFSAIILRDSPTREVGAAANRLGALFGLSYTEILARITGLFTQDDLYARTLFGYTPLSSKILFTTFSLLHAAGFVISAYIVIRERGVSWARMLATLNLCAAIIYLLSWNTPNTPIGDWPQRILTLYAPVTYLAGFVGVLYVLGKTRPLIVAAERRFRPVVWVAPILILIGVAVVQAQVFEFSRQLNANIARARSAILDSGVSNAYVVVSGMDNVQPFYLRCIPFVLFSDDAIIRRNIAINTEWHVQPRHPSRLIESEFNLQRKRYLAEFSANASVVAVQMVAAPMDRFPVHERTDANTWMGPMFLAQSEFDEGTNLLNHGLTAPAFEHFATATKILPQSADPWNDAGAALYQQGHISDSIPYFEASLKLNPRLVAAQVNLAVALIATKRAAEAIPHLEAALKLQPNHSQARRLLEELRLAESPASS